MIKRIILSLLIIAGVSASGVTATKALMSDQATLTANTFSTGTVDLQIATSPVTDYGDTKLGFSNNAMLPGQAVTFPFRLKNNSAGADFSIQGQASINGTNTLPADKISLTFTAVNTSGDPVGAPVTDTLEHWLAIKDFGNPVIMHGQFQRYKMDVKIDEAVIVPSASVNFDLIFTGTQVNPTPTPSPTVTPTVTPTPSDIPTPSPT